MGLVQYVIVHLRNPFEKVMRVENEKRQSGPLGVAYMCIHYKYVLSVNTEIQVEGTRLYFSGSGGKVLYILTETVALHATVTCESRVLPIQRPVKHGTSCR